MVRRLTSDNTINPKLFVIDAENTQDYCEEANKFKCETDGKCVEEKDVCDGSPDCSLITEGDLRDEQNCGKLITTNRL